MQLQDGPRAYLAGYQMEHGHHGADTPLPPGGVVDDFDQDNPAPPSGPVMGVEDAAIFKAKVMAPPPAADPPVGVKGAETE
jgi:hypothetical protein